MTRLFVIAGEASGDNLGASLLAGLKELEPDISFQGIAGPAMQAQGMDSLFPMQELSVMGLAEILPKYRHLKRRIAQTAEAVLAARPDALVTIDSPDFCLRVARIVRAADPGIRIVHYVAPSVWAWRPRRAQKMAAHVDQVLALLPFEPPYMEAVGLRCDFVGHPVVTQPQAGPAEVAALRQRLGIAESAPLVLALPGSRKGEVTRLIPRFGAALTLLKDRHPNLQVLLPAAPHVADLVRQLTANWPQPLHLLDGGDGPEKRAAFAAADVALAASGTVSLELAAADTPMVIGYDMAWLTMKIMQRMALIDTVTLVNIITDSRVVPEFLGENCRPEPMARALADVMADPTAQHQAARQTMQALGRGGEAPGLRAARAVLDGLGAAR
ncbi:MULTISPECIES: lipid-A-disaccharide synthase [unclassified Meridianimarinicoccus]|uniref:lipid-A-disaccharide synthase n=1 Tax=unclassified Meridianimarinicoccus TaxID=2923344 RepID=UPI00299F8B08|nr:lipid-A-disaccharide synthase [Fluviibacterium sp. MJW13]